ncbi:hypothetical protein [Pseudotabrizicola alkalilacus]|uniref:Uncharacterized protein n=1 Tax=Pseudotabrizicola alkalilacus TaxID=2305252 RepID=A0A411YWF1_9RHOB|nr:hypothetical protein [Pseudotabrizicola alkalilacus]RGP35122.1 hypothetical protein D1012_21740 [Pseudotabrizicola alkalilacus]
MKIRKAPIGIDTLEEYLADASDFAFELRILRMLTGKGLECSHGGQYKDPDTGKSREFDIRLRATHGQITVAAAIECKAIGAHFPLLVSCVSRDPSESYQEVFCHQPRKSRPEPSFGFGVNLTHFDPPDLSGLQGKEAMRLGPSPLYPPGQPVGKSTAQVGRREGKENELVANDAEFFEKWSQALQSLDDLVQDMGDSDTINRLWNGRLHFGCALPIVVVPNGTLWSVSFGPDGAKLGPPAQVGRVPIFIGRGYGKGNIDHSMSVSHLEVMTEEGLSAFCDEFLSGPDGLKRLISNDQ